LHGQVSRKEMQATLALRFGGEGILKMKGIPFKAAASDVRKFFAGYKIKPDGISFIMHADGRPTGMAFIEFETPQVWKYNAVVVVCHARRTMILMGSRAA
jgi:hypothetical protein